MENNEEQPKTGIIYALVSPVTFKPRYIGKSTRSLRIRLNEHYSHSMNNRFASGPECDWFQALEDEGLRPNIVCLEEVPLDRMDEREQYWVTLGLSLGWHLLNVDAGGAGRRALVRLTTTTTT